MEELIKSNPTHPEPLGDQQPRGEGVQVSFRRSTVSAKQHQQFLLDQISVFADRKILVVGDIGLDEYVVGDVKRISPEAPVPVVEVHNEEERLGLSGNVAQNITSLGGQAVLVALVGADRAHQSVAQLLQKAGVTADLIVDSARPTIRKMRVMSGQHHIVRVDYEQKGYISEQLSQQLLERIEHHLPAMDGVIVQDYAKGLLSESLMKKIFERAHRLNKKVLVDPHRTTPLSSYRGADLITPNYDESLALARIEGEELVDRDQLTDLLGPRLAHAIDANQVVITLGHRGMRLVERQQVTGGSGVGIGVPSSGSGGVTYSFTDLPTYARRVFDVTGAGDTVIAAMALAWLSGFTLEQACVAANFAAGVVVSKIGCVPCSTRELTEYILTHQ